ncbi:MAG: exodeoxyribonuclease VII large subunit [Candidatus Omnitrophica bacterium]|nr:exodeoxyribonuclease VII large subunit [Candidatus Omnitrophota bacterium]
MSEQKHIYTVSELTKDIRKIIENNFPYLWLEGEISNFKRHSSGHLYLNLKDKDAIIQAVMFKGSADKLQFKPEDGLKITCSGKISVYDQRGQYQIYISSMEPQGLGSLQLAFEQLKEKLKKEGLFDSSRKRPIPFLPAKIGVITSPTGAAIRDILNVLRRRFSNAEIILNPVKVQGNEAKNEIVQAIELFNKRDKIDVMIVARGGGSLEDLWAFNEEIVARAIANSRIPVISAVGHEIDWTIADFVADFRAPTPSAAAELVLPEKEELLNRISVAKQRLKNALQSTVIQYEQRLDELKEALLFRQENFIRKTKQCLDNLIGKLEVLSPLSTIKRGYSITKADNTGKVLKDIKKIKKGDIIRTRLINGEIVSIVDKII